MSRMFFPLLFLSIFIGASISNAGIFSSSDTIRYRITVRVETPEGLKSGTAVREAGRYWERSLLPEQGGTTYNVLKGEAVVVDLGLRGVLFSRMAGQDEAAFVFKSFYRRDGSSPKGPLAYPYAATMTFTDLNNRKTAKSVDPAHLDKAFGEGVSLKDITVEITDEPVTHEIEKYIPWLPCFFGYLSGKHVDLGGELYNSLDSGDFERSEEKRPHGDTKICSALND